MKPSTVLHFAVALLAAAHLTPFTLRAAQSNSPEDQISLLRLDLRARKAEIVLESMELKVDEAQKFVEIYADYDRELSRINAERINIIREFAEHYATMDEDQARRLLKTSMSITRRRLDLLEKTAARVGKALSGRLALRFAQIENQLLLMIDVQIANEMPLIPRDVLLPS